MSYWTGDAWRWGLRSDGSRASISVIESPADKQRPEDARVVPFGFGRALDPPEPKDPVLWDGED